jgi:hypothetical protein
MRFDADDLWTRGLRYTRRAILPIAQRRARRTLDRLLPSWVLAPQWGAFSPDALDLLYLYRLTWRLRPRVIVEYGSGYSTAVFAAALMANGCGHLYSVESAPQWAEETMRQLPRTAPVTMVIRKPVQDSNGWHFGWLAPSPPDLLYVDGPPTTTEAPLTYDAVDEAARMAPGSVIVVDGREAMLTYLRHPAWTTTYHWLRWNGTMTRKSTKRAGVRVPPSRP